FFQFENGGVWIWSLNRCDPLVGTELGRLYSPIENALKREYDILCGEQPAVVEPYVVTEMENISLRIGDVPALGAIRLTIEVLVLRHKRAEDNLKKAFGTRIDGDSRIEVGWRLV